MTAECGVGLYVANRSRLVAYAVPLLGSREAAEDVVQDAFLKFLPASGRTGSREQALGYLYRIVRNLALDALKRRRVEARAVKADLPFWAIPSEARTPEQGVLFCDEVRRVADVLEGLPEETRIAVEMHRFGGYTMEEIAERLGVSVATVHRHVRSALVEIAGRLEDDAP